ncbi:hypothetical protein EIP86_009052 [Pleurotus ostreatoroseus]|nr:hypothetical protein EIP86_009052 [Pleurotus ostreatoroseus]
MTSKASMRIWNTPDLKIHIAKALDMQRDLLHLAETDKATCALLLPLLYENVCVAIDHVSQIEKIFKKYPEYARQCKRLRVESPDKIERSYLEGKMWRDKGVVVNFRPDPSKRYDAGFSPDWEDDAHYVASVTENSDPIDWLVYEDEDATNALDMLLGEANASVSDEENEDSADELDFHEDSADELDFHDAWVDEDGHDDNDSEIFGSQGSAPIQGMDTQPHEDEDASSSEDGDTARRRPVTVLKYWQNLVEKRKDDTSPAWLKKKQIMDGHIQKRLYRSEREIQGSIRFQKACDALVLVLTQLGESSRLASFEWTWEASQGAVWPVTGASRELWAAVEKNSPSLRKLVLKFFWRDRETWVRHLKI